MLNFQPPTEEELEKFKKYQESKPASIKSEKDEEESQTPSDIGDFLKGTAQGATLGFGDEILAALQATVSPEQKSWLERYRQKQKENEAAYQEAQERSPWLTGIGELAGGFALPVGTVLKGAKAAEAAIGAKALQEALTAGKTAEQAAKISQRAKNLYNLKSATKTGATIGGIAGLGTSEGTIEESPGKLASDVATGATFGGVLGAAGSKIGASTSEYIKESPKIQRALRAMGLEAEGINLTTEEGQSVINEKIKDSTKDTAESIINTYKAAGEDLNRKIAKWAGETPESFFNDIRKNPEDASAQLFDILKNNKSLANNFDKLRDYIKAARNGLMKVQKNKITKQEEASGLINVSDLINIRDEIRNNIFRKKNDSNIKFPNSQELGEIEQIPKLIDQILENLDPEIKQAAYTKARMAYVGESFLNDSADASTHSKKMRDIIQSKENEHEGYKELRKQLQNRVVDKIFDSSGTGSRVVDNKKFIRDVAKGFEERLDEASAAARGESRFYPDQLFAELQSDTILSPAKLQGTLEGAYKDLGAMEATEGMKRSADEIKGALGIFEAVSAGKIGVPISIGTESASTIGGKLGRLEYNLGKPVSKSRDLIKTYGVDKLKSMADTLRQSNLPVAKTLGESAMTSLERGDAASRAAFINSVMQHPDLRRILDLELDKD